MTNRASLRTGPALALKQSYGRLYLLLQRQASVLAYIDVFWILGTVTLLAIVLLFFAKTAKARTGRDGALNRIAARYPSAGLGSDLAGPPDPNSR